MLRELHVRDLAVAEAIDLDVAPGFTAVTGETGAGKSILVDALALALGARAQPDAVRAGADALTVEARFQLAPTSAAYRRVAAALRDVGVPFDGDLLIVRSVPAEGRSSARVNDRAVTQATLSELGAALADIHGQHDNVSLLRPPEQLALLDRFGAVRAERDAFTHKAQALRALRERLHGLAGDDRERARRVAQLRYEADEIAAARLQPGEDAALAAELERLTHAQDLARLAESARAALEDDAGAIDALGAALHAVRDVLRIDPTASDAGDALEAAQDQASEALRLLHHYQDGVELDPARLAAAEDRLALIHDLQRRYGDSVADVVAYGDRAAAEADDLDASAERVAALRDEESRAAAEAAAAALQLRDARRRSARDFVQRVVKEAKRLQLPHLVLQVRLDADAAPAGAADALDTAVAPVTIGAKGVVHEDDPVQPVAFDGSGVDRAELWVTFNPDQPPRPLARVASGGETARLLLAIKTVLGDADDVPTLVFDEVDVGLGGRSGGVVGDALRRLARTHQVLCITHLPQVAAYSTAHLRVQKSVSARESRVTVQPIAGDARLRELAEMLGADSDANRRSARELLATVEGS